MEEKFAFSLLSVEFRKLNLWYVDFFIIYRYTVKSGKTLKK